MLWAVVNHNKHGQLIYCSLKMLEIQAPILQGMGHCIMGPHVVSPRELYCRFRTSAQKYENVS